MAHAVEGLNQEIKPRSMVARIFLNETSARTLATEIALRSSEEWALKRYLSMDVLQAVEKPNLQLSRR